MYPPPLLHPTFLDTSRYIGVWSAPLRANVPCYIGGWSAPPLANVPRCVEKRSALHPPSKRTPSADAVRFIAHRSALRFPSLPSPPENEKGAHRAIATHGHTLNALPGICQPNYIRHICGLRRVQKYAFYLCVPTMVVGGSWVLRRSVSVTTRAANCMKA